MKMVSEKEIGAPLLILTVATGLWIYTNMGQAEMTAMIIKSLFFSTFISLFILVYKQVMKRIGF